MTTEMSIPNPDGMPTGQVRHIRCRPRPARGNQFYRDRGPSGAEKTLCGDPNTIWDVSWAETRHAKHRAIVNCGPCVEERVAQGVAPQKVK